VATERLSDAVLAATSQGRSRS